MNQVLKKAVLAVAANLWLVVMAQEPIRVMVTAEVNAPRVVYIGLPVILNTVVHNETPKLPDLTIDYASLTDYERSVVFARTKMAGLFSGFDLLSPDSGIELKWWSADGELIYVSRPSYRAFKLQDPAFVRNAEGVGGVGLNPGEVQGRLTDVARRFGFNKDRVGTYRVTTQLLAAHGAKSGYAGNELLVEVRELSPEALGSLQAALQASDLMELPFLPAEWVAIDFANYNVLSELPRAVSETLALYAFLNSAAVHGSVTGARLDLLSFLPEYLEDVAAALRYEVVLGTESGPAAATLREEIAERLPAVRWRLEAADKGEGLLAKAIALRRTLKSDATVEDLPDEVPDRAAEDASMRESQDELAGETPGDSVTEPKWDNWVIWVATCAVTVVLGAAFVLSRGRKSVRQKN